MCRVVIPAAILSEVLLKLVDTYESYLRKQKWAFFAETV